MEKYRFQHGMEEMDDLLYAKVKHTGSWLANLKRANDKRKKESVDVLQKVISDTRKTSVYVRLLKKTGKRSHQIESELTML